MQARISFLAHLQQLWTGTPTFRYLRSYGGNISPLNELELADNKSSGQKWKQQAVTSLPVKETVK